LSPNARGLEFADLEGLINPSSVVLVGASDTPGSVGFRLAHNAIDVSTIRGEVFIVNARRPEVHGQKAYASVLDLPAVPDVAVIVVAANLVPGIVRDCATLGIPYAAVLSSGFSEVGAEGLALERELQQIVRETGIRIYGPNCPGISNINHRIGLNFSPAFADDQTTGVIGLATQGGGLGRTVLQAMERGLGVSLWMSSGNEADLEISDFIYHLAESPDVKVIAAVIEGIRSGPRFAAAALHARRMNKPIIAIKLGRSEYGKKAAMSHTTSMTGEAEVNSAVFAQLGIVEVEDLDELIDTAALFAQRLPTTSETVSIYTYSGGTAALTADMIGAKGLTLTEFTDETTLALQTALPRFGTHANPVDTGTEVLADSKLIRATLEPVLSDPGVGVTVVPFPIEMGQTTAELASVVVALRDETGATIVPVWMTDRLGAGYRTFADGGLVPSRSIRNAVGAIDKWIAYGKSLAGADLDWAPAARSAVDSDALGAALSEVDAKARLGAAGIDVPQGRICTSLEQVTTAVAELGYPLALKIVSADILHKSDAGGVRLGVSSEADAVAAFGDILAAVKIHHPAAAIDGVLVEQMISGDGYESILAVHIDPTFGPLITFGTGGVLVELVKDAARQLLPLSESSARALIADTKLGEILAGQRGRQAVDLDALVTTLTTVSEFVLDNPSILELEINPLWISESGDRVVALDSLVIEQTAAAESVKKR
jgi:acyl-CoA synthetase (NDP forming)